MDESLKALVCDVLNRGYVMSLGVSDEDGPWVADVLFLHDDDLNIYWVSSRYTKHSTAIGQSAPVAASITASDGSNGAPEAALQISGIAERIAGPLPEMGARHRTKRGKRVPPPGEDFIEPHESWYRLKPQRIELIYAEKFGRDRHRVF